MIKNKTILLKLLSHGISNLNKLNEYKYVGGLYIGSKHCSLLTSIYQLKRLI